MSNQKPINHKADTLSEALGINVSELHSKHNDLVSNTPDEKKGMLSHYAELIEKNLNKRELATIYVHSAFNNSDNSETDSINELLKSLDIDTI